MNHELDEVEAVSRRVGLYNVKYLYNNEEHVTANSKSILLMLMLQWPSIRLNVVKGFHLNRHFKIT